MVDQTQTLNRLNKEKQYEDKLASDILGYFISYLELINGLTEKEKQILRKDLSEIAHDSERHSYLFNQLIQMVLENGEDNY